MEKVSKEREQTGFFIQVLEGELEKRKNLSEKVLETHSNGVSNLHIFPYRKKVELKQDILDLDVMSYTYSYLEEDINKYTSLRKLIKKAFNEEVFDSLTFKEKEELFFKQGNNEVVYTDKNYKKHTVTKEEYDLFFKRRKAYNQAMEFYNVREHVNSEDYLPINRATKHYIKFNKEQVLVSLRLESSNYRTGRITSKFISCLQNFIKDTGIEIVNIDQTENATYVNLLSEKENFMLNGLREVISQCELYRTEESFNYNLEVEIERNLHQENYSKDWYYFFTGNKYEELKDMFKKQESNFLAHPLYK
ncbi:hypothetical protein P4493_05100 [Bacillus thuringiensis]|uniref:Uncharacterized protein n=3 Tax=Bacillus thuringiensis TaxID=1428 RepID=A0A0B5NIZ1_BACTU|nr:MULTISPECIES: hypothetical protein [Bacillus]MEC2535597.1 hypothetical protein [Bacillus cereus]MED1153628.1 hypothetical protein [Bacillus paranthracis]OUB09486.1 hypothetical protein BK708_33770 [Bacillus thuringiensis serovar yunnanensis]AFQ29953.1 hypothetical protein BTF1_29262 [Bacillus thuringiensis HD-789]AJG73936.1 hypothetical protein BF38_5742 [Bacillus thuringiensis]